LEAQGAKPTGGAVESPDGSLGKAQEALIDTWVRNNAMDVKRLAVRVTDIGRILDRLESPVLGSHYRATLPASRMARLLVSLQGQDVIPIPAVESIAHKEVGIASLELHRTYLPLFQDWGFIRVYEDRIEEDVKSRESVLTRVEKFWEESNPHPVEELSVKLFDSAALAPQHSDIVQRLVDNYKSEISTSAFTHLREGGLVDKFTYENANWYYSPEIFGENYPAVIKFVSSHKEKRADVYSIIETVLGDQGIPHDLLCQVGLGVLIDQIVGAGLLMGYPLSIGKSSQVFYFTPDLRNRFEREGRGDKFELIKTGISHFQFAHRMANKKTGRLKFSPYVLLDRLLEKGVAGNATAIGTDYYLLVQKGLVKTEPTSGTRYRFLLPDSKEKISDLQTIRDSFRDKWVVPKIDISVMGIPSGALPGDSIAYRSKKVVAGRELAREFAREVYKL